MNKKVKIVIISSIILLIPAGYFAYIAYAELLYGRYVELSQQHEEGEEVDELLAKAIRINPRVDRYHEARIGNLVMMKEYREAIEAADKYFRSTNKKGEALFSKGTSFEYLELPDSAKICYQQAIPYLEGKLSEDSTRSDLVMTLSLLYCVLEDRQGLELYFTHFPEFFEDKYFLESGLTTYLKNYKGKGVRGFYDPVEIELVFLYESSEIDADSLLDKMHITYSKFTHESGDDTSIYYKVREELAEELEPHGFVPEDYFETKQH